MSISKKLPKLRRKFLPEEGPINDFYRNMVSSKRSLNGIELCEGYLALGATSEWRLSELEIQALGNFLGSAPALLVVNSFKWMRSAYNGILHSRLYEHMHCRHSFTVHVRARQNTQEYGHIEFFPNKANLFLPIWYKVRLQCSQLNFANKVV